MTVAQALAQICQQSAISLVTHVPGFGASQVFQACNSLKEWPMSYHEEVALGMTLGAALSGHPSLCLIKMHGLLKAANALVCGLSAGVSAACVIVVFDDPGGGHSDNQLPTLQILQGLEVPLDWVDDPQAAPQALWDSLQRSQAQQLPRVLVIDSAAVDQEFQGALPKGSLAPVLWQPDPVGQLVCPLFGHYQRERLLSRLHHRPAPTPPALPDMDTLPPHWKPTLQAYQPWIEAALAQGKAAFVAGDTGLSSLFGLEPWRAVDAIGWMGGSLPLALGALAAGHPSAWAITGDFSFLAAGHLGWQEARRRKLPLRVLLFDNGRAQATGGQLVDRDSLCQLLIDDQVIRLTSPDRLDLHSPTDRPLLYWLEVG